MNQLEQLKRRMEMMNFHQRSIEACGISIMNVGESGFSYSMGASRSGLPDMILTNVGAAASQHILNTVFSHWKQHGFQDGRITGLFESADNSGRDMAIYVKLIDYNENLIDNYVTQAWNFYQLNPEYVHPKHGIRYVQIFCPDENGRTQFEPGFNMKYHQMLVEEPINSKH